MPPRPGFRALTKVDAWANRVYGSRFNPLYHSGAIAVVMLLVLLGTGLYLLIFYRIGAPYDSVARINEQVWTGRWIRALHRFASDVAVIAVLVHAFRMYAQRRAWGARALAWISGVILLAVVLLSGWTGYVLVWDLQAQVLASEGARWLDVLPIFSEPIGRSFTGEQAVPNAFFFLNLFAHIALPIGVAALVWVHVARVARPVLLPAPPVLWGSLIALLVLSLLWPLPMAPHANALRIPQNVPIDWFFAFWLPITQRMPAGAVWIAGAALVGTLISIPRLTRPRIRALTAPAVVNERTCTGCEQCLHDCPYDAITMVPRTDGRNGFVARVETALCTSCGVCVGSCPPMAIGPAGVTARDQLQQAREFVEQQKPGANDVVIVGCEWSAAAAVAAQTGAKLLSVPCVGAMHSSTVETLLRRGAGGVLVVGCPEHDGRTREGVTWTRERLFDGRPADLKQRVDRSRVRLVQATLGEHVGLHASVMAFAADIEKLAGTGSDVDVVAWCMSNASADMGEST